MKSQHSLLKQVPFDLNREYFLLFYAKKGEKVILANVKS